MGSQRRHQCLVGWDCGLWVAPQAHSYAADVDVHEGDILLIRKAGNSPSGVGAESWQCAENRDVTGEHAGILIAYRLGGLLEVQGTAVIAQSLPGGDDGAGGCVGEGVDIGEPCEKRMIFGDDPLDLGLLEHHL